MRNQNSNEAYREAQFSNLLKNKVLLMHFRYVAAPCVAPLEVGLGVICAGTRREDVDCLSLDLPAFLGKVEATGQIHRRNTTFHTAN
jgi:hypothetical protein